MLQVRHYYIKEQELIDNCINILSWSCKLITIAAVLFICLSFNGAQAQTLALRMPAYTFNSGSSYEIEVGKSYPSYRPGKLIVKIEPKASEGSRYRGGQSLSELNQSLGLKEIIPLFPAPGGKRRMKTSYKSGGLYLFNFEDDISVEDLAKVYNDSPDVEFAMPDYIIQWPVILPVNPYSDMFWALNKIKAPKAWDFIRWNKDVVVAVIDSGVDYEHEDLAQNMWVNDKELDGDPNRDDDGNGYIDDIYGVNLAGDSQDPMDTYGHGTHVAGIIAALKDNNVGTVGVNWQSKIMAIKLMDPSQEIPLSTFISNAIKAIEYAIDMGADMINASWGFSYFNVSLRDFLLYYALHDTIKEAEQAGILFVAAAGNDSVNIDISPTYPACYDLSNIISVAATDWNDNLATFSNYGSKVDLAAPGVGICSTVPGDDYDYMDGTSMAAPFVTGVAALVKAMYPEITLKKLKNRILKGADWIASSNVKRLNAYNSLRDRKGAQPPMKVNNGGWWPWPPYPWTPGYPYLDYPLLPLPYLPATNPLPFIPGPICLEPFLPGLLVPGSLPMGLIPQSPILPMTTNPVISYPRRVLVPESIPMGPPVLPNLSPVHAGNSFINSFLPNMIATTPTTPLHIWPLFPLF